MKTLYKNIALFVGGSLFGSAARTQRTLTPTQPQLSCA